MNDDGVELTFDDNIVNDSSLYAYMTSDVLNRTESKKIWKIESEYFFSESECSTKHSSLPVRW